MHANCVGSIPAPGRLKNSLKQKFISNKNGNTIIIIPIAMALSRTILEVRVLLLVLIKITDAQNEVALSYHSIE